MSLDDLSSKYMRLRADLACAYGQAVWNSRHIDTLTEQIADTEFAMATAGGTEAFVDVARFSPTAAAGTAVARF